MELIADAIFLIHVIIVSFVLVAPISNSLSVLILHVAFSLTLMLHWSVNSNVCCLSVMESWFRKVSISKTFMNRIMEPIYVISENNLSNVIWGVTILLAVISCYKISIHKNLGNLVRCRDFKECVKLLS